MTKTLIIRQLLKRKTGTPVRFKDIDLSKLQDREEHCLNGETFSSYEHGEELPYDGGTKYTTVLSTREPIHTGKVIPVDTEGDPDVVVIDRDRLVELLHNIFGDAEGYYQVYQMAGPGEIYYYFKRWIRKLEQ